MPIDYDRRDGEALHAYIPQTTEDRRQMLEVISQRFPEVQTVDDLFKDVPKDKRYPNLNLPPALSESELRRSLGALARRNTVADEYGSRPSFLGGGTYRHHIPAAVNAISGRGEFTSPYTPYQFEIAQGTLQTGFEFQSFLSILTGMEIVNTGMYEGASATAETGKMARRLTGRENGRVLVADTVNPRILDVMNTYFQGGGVESFSTEANLDQVVNEQTACVVVQYPNYFGVVEDLEQYAEAAHKVGAKLIVNTYPMALGLLEPPGSFGADMVTGDAQCLGNPLNFGGPSVGILACRDEDKRQMPGRLIGVAYDGEGRRGYVLTLQTREQHIRREKATSNVCTTGALVATRSTMYLALTGSSLAQIADENYRGAAYAMAEISKIPGFKVPDVDQPHFNEFVACGPIRPSELNRRLLDISDILGGIDVSSDRYPNGMLFCVTEMNTRQEVDLLLHGLSVIGYEEGYAGNT